MTEKIKLSGVKSGPDRTYTIDVPAGVPAVNATCTAHAVYMPEKCGRPAKAIMTDGNISVEVCGIHQRSLKARGWTD